mgnify:CR=1 FL=1
MSVENADRFLIAVARNATLRESFKDVQNPKEFAEVASKLGYEFTPEDIKAAVAAHSQGVKQRRTTGVWEWLRRVHWIERDSSNA